MKQAIAFLTKDPVPGRAKTRLAKEIGAQQAAHVHEVLAKHCFSIAAQTAIPTIVYLDGDPQGTFAAHIKSQGFIVKPQTTGTLSEKIHQALRSAQRTCVLGTDTPNISPEMLKQSLATSGVVFGPAFDGGFWMLTSAALPNDVLQNIPWSTELVLQKTIAQIRQHNLEYTLYPQLRDVDHLSDLLQVLSHPSTPFSLRERLATYARSSRISP